MKRSVVVSDGSKRAKRDHSIVAALLPHCLYIDETMNSTLFLSTKLNGLMKKGMGPNPSAN